MFAAQVLLDSLAQSADGHIHYCEGDPTLRRWCDNCGAHSPNGCRACSPDSRFSVREPFTRANVVPQHPCLPEPRCFPCAESLQPSPSSSSSMDARMLPPQLQPGSAAFPKGGAGSLRTARKSASPRSSHTAGVTPSPFLAACPPTSTSMYSRQAIEDRRGHRQRHHLGSLDASR
jgi:hypothetical protein